MALDTNDNGLLAVDCFPINLRRIEDKVGDWLRDVPNIVAYGKDRVRGSYGANSTGVVLFDVGPHGRVTGISPRPQRRLTLVRLGVAGLLPQVVIPEGDLVVWVKEAAVTQVSVLCYKDLQGKSSSKTLLKITALYYDTTLTF